MKSHQASGPRLGLAAMEADDRAARARRTALLLFERRRSRLAAGLRRPKRPRRRYEDLRLATALSRAESRCLVEPGEHGQAPVDECLIAGLELQLVSMQESLERMERWLSPETRQRAESEAEERFRTIAHEVRTELVSQGLVRPGRDSGSERDSAAAARCAATTLKGARCKNRVKTNGVCAVHARVENSPAALPATPARAPSESTTMDPSAVDQVAVSVYVARLRALSESFGRDPVPVPDLAAIRAWLPSLDLAAARARVRALVPAQKPELRLPRLELEAWRSRLPAWPERDRLDAPRTWALGGSVALAAAAALIWSGLAEDGSHAPGGEVEVASANNLPALPVSSAGSETNSSEAATAPARTARRDAPDEGGSRRAAEAGQQVGEPAEPSLREPGAASVAPDAGPSGSGASEEPAPAPAPAPVPEPAPEPGGGPDGEAPESPEPEPSPPPNLTDTVNGVVSDLSKTAGDVLDQIPLVGAP